MAQDSDVARVAAALKAPGLRYRSFGNEPVRAPRVDTTDPGEVYPPLGLVEGLAAESPGELEVAGHHEPMPGPASEPYGAMLAEPTAYTPPSYSQPAPEPAAAPMLIVPIPLEPPAPAAAQAPAMTEAPRLVPVPSQLPAAPLPPVSSVLLAYAAPAYAAPPPATMQAASEPPAPVFVQPPSVAATPNFILAPTVGWAPNQPPVSDGAPAYSLLEVIGRQLDLGPSIAGNTAMFPQGLHQEPRQAPYAPAGHDHGRQSQPPYGGPAPGSTFASLLAGVSGSPAAGPEAPNTAADPAAAPLPSPVLPAAAVTISLSEVLQLVAAGGPVASSPFDALRVAVRAPGSR